jgi:hypothetical protein
MSMTEDKREDTPEQQAEARLRELGYAVTDENPLFRVGTETKYSIGCKKVGTNDPEIEGLGDSRLNALNACITVARSR